MKIKLHKKFLKQYKKLKANHQKKFKERRDIYLYDQFHPVLNNHPLTGRYSGYRSFSVTGDLRVIFKHESTDSVILVNLDSHNNLYGWAISTPAKKFRKLTSL